MKKFALIGAVMAALAAVAGASPAQAGFKGCCGGWTGGGGFGGHHWGYGGGLSIGLVGVDSGIGGDCFYTRRAVFVPGIGLVSRRELVCS